MKEGYAERVKQMTRSLEQLQAGKAIFYGSKYTKIIKAHTNVIDNQRITSN